MVDSQTSFNPDETYKAVVKEFTDAKALVESCLSEDFRSRNNDLWLLLKAWEKQGIAVMIDWERFQELFSFETIRRTRQEIQNTEGRFLPTDPDVLIKRKYREEAIRDYYGAKSFIFKNFQKKRYEIK